ncbi:pyridoxal phosphate-dependent aminotransferase [Streptosporangium roseum]|uniref:Aminotransferase n=1 Tax=Streptosporangium roseum (strain ATCC 12428 / DSM 43021 / JCM 3005 / KCTC 9067 / NCIMB 10171 / NRRL 2505 / NI 9100) TaxID=479432 RepID=D2BCT9_STRRD|nr:pyridoxal phosphate-dependent aminotransferase [Streptosporangium roseum]ACZ91909.1 aminotransferase [Streptosporangium roseum DSM 43021]
MNVTLSATLAANEDIERRRRAGERVLHLAFGEAGLPVHPALRERLIAASEHNGYGPVAGAAALREAAAGYWHRRGLPTDPELVVCGPGSKSLLYGLLLAIGGDIVLPMPSWVSYAAQADLVGARPLLVPAPPGEGGVPDPERVVSAVLHARSQGRDVRSLLVTLPDNPSGTLAAARTIRRITEVARDLDLTIISDEIYRDLVHDTAAGFLSPAELAPERTVITSGLSKSLALGGWRIGVARLPSVELRDRLLAVASEIWSSPAAPVQQAAAYAYTEPAELVERIDESRRLHGTVARAVYERFVRAGVRVDAPQGGFYLYPDFTGLAYATSAELTADLLDRHGVGVLPGHAFGDDPRALRVRVATSLLYGETTERRLAALGAADPLELPWISASLDHLSEALTGLNTARHAPGRLVRAALVPTPAAG